jgi:hypothetical protein
MIPGVVPTSLGLMADRLGWTTDEVRETMGELEQNGDAAFDPAGLVWLPRGVDHNPPDSSKNVKGWARHWSEVPSCPLKLAVWSSLRSWLAMNKGEVTAVSFEESCKRPVLSGRKTSGQMPHAMPHREGHAVPHAMPHPMPVAGAVAEAGAENRESACAGAPAPARALDKSPQTSPSGHVVAEVVSTEPPPSRTPPAPVEVVASSPTVTTAPSSHATGPLAASAAQDDDEPPPAQRCPSTPRPGASVQAAPPVTPAPPVATPSAPAQPSLLPDLDAAPAEDAPPVAIPRVADLDDRTPANRVLRAWGSQMYRAHQQPLATEARRRVVRDRLRVFSEADLIRALTGALTDPYVNGRSDRAPSGGQRDIAWLFAKVERVEGFLRAVPAPPPPPSPRPAPRMPPPLKPGEVRPVISVEDYERNAFAPVLPRRMTAADLAAYEQGGAHVG